MFKTLPYIDVWDDMVLMADGSFGIAWEVPPFDLLTFNDELIDQLEDQINQLYLTLPQGSLELKEDVDHRNAGVFFQILNMRSNDFSDIIERMENVADVDNALLRDLTKENINFIKNIADDNYLVRRRVYIMARIYPEVTTVKKIASFFKYEPSLNTIKEQLSKKVIRAVKHELNLISTALNNTALNPRRLGDKELRKIIYNFLNPNSYPASATDDPTQTLRSLVLPDFTPGHFMFQLDGMWHAVVGVRSLPRSITSCSGTIFATALGDVIQNFSLVPRYLMEKQIVTDKKKMKLSAMTDKRAGNALEELEQALELIINGSDFCRASWHVVLRDENPETLNLKIRDTMTMFGRVDGMEGRPERNAADVIFFSTCVPFANSPMSEKHSRRNMPAALPWVTNTAPLYGPYPGTATRPVLVSPTTSNPPSLFVFDPFDESMLNWNTILLGKSGAGKSTLMIRLAVAFLLYKPLLFFVDKGGSFEWMATLTGGEHHTLSRTSPKCLNVFDLKGIHPSNGGEQEEFVQSSMIFATNFVESLAGGLSNQEFGIVANFIGELWRERDYATYYLSDLIEALDSHGSEHAKSVADRLRMYKKGSTFGNFFDGPSEMPFEAETISIDMGDIYEDERLVGPYFMAVDRLLTLRAAKEMNRKHIFCFDEVWAPIAVPQCRKALMDKNRTVRKNGGAVWYLDQTIKTFLDYPETTKMISQTSNWFLLEMNPDDIKDLAQAGFTDQEMRLIRTLRTVPGEYSMNYARTIREGIPRGAVTRSISTPLLYSVMTNDADDKMIRNQLIKRITDEKPTTEELELAIRQFAKLLPRGTRPMSDRINRAKEKYPHESLLDIVEMISQ